MLLNGRSLKWKKKVIINNLQIFLNFNSRFSLIIIQLRLLFHLSISFWFISLSILAPFVLPPPHLITIYNLCILISFSFRRLSSITYWLFLSLSNNNYLSHRKISFIQENENPLSVLIMFIQLLIVVNWWLNFIS